MPPLLAVSAEPSGELRLRTRLAEAGFADVVGAACNAMVQTVAELAPLQVVVGLSGGRDERDAAGLQALMDALRGWGAMAPCPVLLWLTDTGAADAPGPMGAASRAADADEATQRSVTALLGAGLHACLVGPLPPTRLRAELAWAQARWQREAALLQALARTRGQLDDRKWVDRAKGVLMSARQIGEEEAFALLRGASMHTNLRVGEVSRAVIEAAQWAEAVNRAGQLRMLSQRLARLAAQRVAGIELRRTRTLQQASLARVQDNLDHLGALPWATAAPCDEGGRGGGGQGEGGAEAIAPPTLGEGLARSVECWQVLRDALSHKASSLAQIDAHAEALLLAAEDLTSALEAAAGRRALRIVNLCGRQRMRVQRAAKEALLAALLQQPQRQLALQATLDEFGATLLELERAPLSSPEIRAGLQAAREEWGRLLRALGSVAQAEGRALLARSCEALLEIFDRLTAAYEHSLQVILN